MRTTTYGVLFLVLAGTSCSQSLAANGSDSHESTFAACDARPALSDAEVALEFPSTTQGCVEYRSRLVHASVDDDWFVETSVCNQCAYEIALRTTEERGDSSNVTVEATEYGRFIGQMQSEGDDGRWVACPLFQTDEERHSVEVDATIPAGQAIHHRKPIDSWRRIDGQEGGRPASVQRVFHALPSAGRSSEAGDADRLPVSEACAKSFEELDLSGPVVSADMPSELASALGQ